VDDEIRPKALMIPFDKFVILDILPPEQYKNTITKMRRYVEHGEEPDGLEPLEQMAFEALRPFMDENIKTYQRSVLSHRESGCKGGRPKKTEKNQMVIAENREKPNGFPEKPAETKCTPKYKGQSTKYKVQSSSTIVDSDTRADARDDLTTTIVFEEFRDRIGKLSETGKKELPVYVERLGADLVTEIIRKCEDLGGHSWAYVRKALAEAARQGCKDIAMQNLKMGVRIASTTSEVMKVVVFLTNFRVIISYQIEL
jgi:hypothetical protein